MSSRIGWVIGSYFAVSGGFLVATTVLGLMAAQGMITSDSSLVLLVTWAAGAFVASYLAARASEGETIVEPAVGALAFIASLVAMFMATPLGDLVVWLFKELQTAEVAEGNEASAKAVAGMVGGAFFVGGLAGAFVGEKSAKEPASGVLFHSLFSYFLILGGMFVGLYAAIMTSIADFEALAQKTGDAAGDEVAKTALLGLAIGAGLGGLVAKRVGGTKGSTALGAIITGAYFYMFVALSGDVSDDAKTGIIALTIAIMVLGLLGHFVGFVLPGGRAAKVAGDKDSGGDKGPVGDKGDAGPGDMG
jgi:hypothetical protein